MGGLGVVRDATACLAQAWSSSTDKSAKMLLCGSKHTAAGSVEDVGIRQHRPALASAAQLLCCQLDSSMIAILPSCVLCKLLCCDAR